MEGMFSYGTRYAWAEYVLGQLYHYLHDCAYMFGASMSVGVTVLHVWAYEHILVMRLLG